MIQQSEYHYGKAPVRLSFGSCADTDYYLDMLGWGNALNATINSYCYCTVKQRPDNKIYVASQVAGEEATFNRLEDIDYDAQRALNMMKAVVQYYQATGIDLVTYTDAPLESGLGGSAAHAVSIIRALNSYCNMTMSAEEVARLAYHIEREQLGIPGGYQDQWAAAFRGINHMHFHPDAIAVHPLSLSEEDLTYLEERLLLVYIPREAQGKNVHEDQKERRQDNTDYLYQKRDIVTRLFQALHNKQFDRFGELLSEEWELKKQLSPVITEGPVNDIYETAMAAGATGGRFLGAGAGGCALFYCPHDKEQVFQALQEYGVQKVPFKFERRALKIDNRVRQAIFDHYEMVGAIIRNNVGTVQEITRQIVESYKQGGKLILFGNGGSAADAQHIAAELVNKQYMERPMLDAIALTVNPSVVTAIANDSGYDEVFARQIENHATDKDVVIGISTSGNSSNIVRGIEMAQRQGAYTIGFTGEDGGKLGNICDLTLQIPSHDVARIQEGHMLAGHIICENVEREFFGDSND